MAVSSVSRWSAVAFALGFALVNGCGSTQHGDDDDDDGGSSGESGSDGSGLSHPGGGAAGRASTGGSDAGGEPGAGATSGGTSRGGSAGGLAAGGSAQAGEGEGAMSNGAQAGDGASANGGSTNGGSTNGGSSNGGDGGTAGDANPPEPVVCGDYRLDFSEACEDGNLEDNDGCSHDCQVEPGYVCDAVRCDENREHCKLAVSVIYRDFNAHAATGGHPDFGPGVISGGAFLGAVQPTLDSDGKPVLSNAADATHGFFHGQAAFAEWYRDEPPASEPIAEQLTLWDIGGTYANMWGPNGETWQSPPTYSNVVYGGALGSGCDTCTPSPDGVGACFDPCAPWGVTDEACCADVTPHFYLGDPLFFPIDDADARLSETRYEGEVPPSYGFSGWPGEQDVAQSLGVSTPVPTASTTFPSSTHNFNFTTEITLWFRFDGSLTTFRVTGDDDLWLFINGRLAVDLGGYHTPLEGSASLGYAGDQIVMSQTPADGATPVKSTALLSDFGISLGSVYQVKVFHAEREKSGSTLSLAVSNGNQPMSVCH